MYRDASDLIAADNDARRAAATPALLSGIDLASRRRARVVFGATASNGAAVLVIGMLIQQPAIGWVIPIAWGVAIIAYVLSRVLGGRRLRRQFAHVLAPSGDVYRDAAALGAGDVIAEARTLALRYRHESYAWPLVAAVLLGPLTMHMAIGAMIDGDPLRMSNFDDWMAFSSVLTAHVYAYGVYVAWTFPRTRTLGRHIIVATAISLVPGVILLGIPAAVVFVTAGVLGLVAFQPMDRIMEREEIAELRIQPTPTA